MADLVARTQQAGTEGHKGAQPGPTPPLKQPNRTNYNQFRLTFQGENGAAGHPVGPNTDEIPTPASTPP